MILLVAPSGAGKSTLARKLFGRYEVLSSDECRALVCNDATDQSASGDAFRVLHELARMRARRGVLTVIDATNVSTTGRRPLLQIAREEDVPLGALVLDLPEALVRERNVARGGPFVVPEHIVTQQLADFASALERLPAEGFAFVHKLTTQADVDAAVIERAPWERRPAPAEGRPVAPSSRRPPRRT